MALQGRPPRPRPCLWEQQVGPGSQTPLILIPWLSLECEPRPTPRWLLQALSPHTAHVTQKAAGCFPISVPLLGEEQMKGCEGKVGRRPPILQDPTTHRQGLLSKWG